MADTSVAVTAGSGTNIDTRTEGTNGNHRQVIVVGDPATNAGVAPVDATAGLKVDLGADNDVTVTNATAANLKVDGSDVTQPVSGTVTANLGATDNAVLDSIVTNTTGLAGTVSGSELQVDVVGSLPAGTNAIGKLSANSGVDIGDVDVTSVDGVAAEAAALGNGILIQGDDGTDRKNINVDATTGDVQVDVTNTVTVDLGANNDVTVTGTVDLGATDNAVLDTIATNTGAALTDAQLRATPVPISGSVTADLGANNDVTVTSGSITETNSTAILADTANIDTNVGTIAGAVSGTEMQVDVVGALPAGTNAIGKLAANSGVDIGDVTLTAGTNAIGTLLPPDVDVTAHTNYARKYYTAATPTDGIIWSPAAGKRWHVVTMYINVSAASTVTLEDDKAGGDDPVWKGEIAANSGVVLSFTEQYPMSSGEDAADLTITATAGTVYVTCVGYEV